MYFSLHLIQRRQSTVCAWECHCGPLNIIKTFISRFHMQPLVQVVFVWFVLRWAWYNEGCLDSGEGSYSGLNIVWQTAKRTEWLLRKLVLWLQTLVDVDEDKLAYSAAKTPICPSAQKWCLFCSRWQLLHWQTDVWNACFIRKRKSNKNSKVRNLLLTGGYHKIAVIHNATHALLSLNCF